MQVIYRIKNLEDNRCYIGSAITFTGRKCVHLKSLRSGNHYNFKLQKDFKKYGEDNFSFEILETVKNKEDLIVREQFYIDSLLPYYNICKIAGSTLGYSYSKEIRDKISKHFTTKRNAIKDELIDLYTSGHSKAAIARKLKTSVWRVQRILIENNIKIKKASEFHTIKINQYSTNNKFIATWDSCSQASISLNIDLSSLCKCAKGKIKTAGGYIWKYN